MAYKEALGTMQGRKVKRNVFDDDEMKEDYDERLEKALAVKIKKLEDERGRESDEEKDDDDEDEKEDDTTDDDSSSMTLSSSSSSSPSPPPRSSTTIQSNVFSLCFFNVQQFESYSGLLQRI